MYEEELSQEPDVVYATDDDGNEVALEILDYFFYNGEEYAIMTEYDEASDNAETDAGEGAEDTTAVDCFVMKIAASTDENGEEIEEFLPVEDEALEAKLIEIATTRMNEDDDPDDAE